MNKFKKLFVFGMTIFVLVFSVSLMLHKSNIVLAEDDEEEERDDDDERYEIIDTSPEKNEVQKTEYKTITTKLSDTVTKTAIVETKHDSDGDGVFDEEDAHPTINEHFIVRDDNLNGIDDKYEQL